MTRQVSDINVLENRVLPTPEALAQAIPRSDEMAELVVHKREEIRRILDGKDGRLLAVVGPCSIHDVEAGREYAEKLKALADALAERILLVMRVYFEKPRTTVGWKGLIMDPHLDGSYNITEGLQRARQFLRDVLALGLPTATELLDPITPQYIADLICYSAIGARTTESQTHRQMASGLSMPLGFKNGTGGNVQLAVNAIKASRQPQTFLGVSRQGLASAVTTRGNPGCHLILRGGSDGPNYDEKSVAQALTLLQKADVPEAILVDCSHANSGKDPQRQPEVLAEVVRQRQAGASALIGVMIESNLVAGNQSFPRPLEELTYGQSITDGCLDWPTTEQALRSIFSSLG